MQAILQNLGLTKNETQVYLTLLEHGPSIVAYIAEHAGIYRPYVYDTLSRLEEKGLVASFLQDNKKHYSAIEPNQLLQKEETKLEQLKTIIPKLKDMQKIPQKATQIELFTGKKALRVIQKDIIDTLLKKREESLVIGVNEKRFMETDKITMLQFFKSLHLYKLKEKVLVREGDSYLPGHKDTTTYRFLPKAFFDPTSTFIYGDTVAIIIFDTPLYAIRLKSNAVAKAYKKQFNLLWSIAKKRLPYGG